jgi:hypothetical protein
MNKFKLSKWIPSTRKTRGKSHEELQASSQNVRHRANRYWTRRP